jgi:hypothetical protein
MITSLRFHSSIAPAPPDASTTAGPSAPRTKRPSDNPLETLETPATSIRRGSFNYDRERGDYLLEWSNLDAFNAWHQEEELHYLIELIASIVKHRGPLWTEKWLYVCSCQLSRGQKLYKKKNPG